MHTDTSHLTAICAALNDAQVARSAFLQRFAGWHQRCHVALSGSVDDMLAAKAELEREFAELRDHLREASVVAG